MKKYLFLLVIPFTAFYSCKKKCDTCPSCPPSVIDLKNGLIAYYPFSGNAGDSSGKNNHGTIFGGLTFTADKDGKAASAAEFDGTDDYIIAEDKGSLTPNAITISAYYNTSSTQVQNLFNKRKKYDAVTNADHSGLTWSVNAYSGIYAGFNNAQFGVPPNTASCDIAQDIEAGDLVYSLESIQTNKWYHIVCIFETNGSQRMYINGKIRQATIRNFTSLKQCPGGQLIIGSFVKGFPAYFKGKIDEVRLYNRALNEEEIKELAKGF
jgi:hypothetical protein